jgi:hypothetical protein
MAARASRQQSSAGRLRILLLLTLPLLILFFLPGGGIIGVIWFRLFALMTILLLWSMIGRPEDAGSGTPPFNDVTPLSRGRKALSVVAFIILAAILIPMPEGVSSPQAQNMRCPYL